MKVLWFTNNHVNLASGVVTGGWMQSLEQAITKIEGIELYIATRARKGDTPGRFIAGNTTYIVIPDNRSLFKKRIDIFFNREPDEYFLNQYLEIIQSVCPDVIQIFGSEMNYGLICEHTKVPVVLHIQGVLNPYLYQLSRIHFTKLQLAKSQSFKDLIRGSTYGNSLRSFSRRARNESRFLKACPNVIGRTDWDKRVMTILAPNARYFHCDELLRSDFFACTWHYHQDESINIVSVISSAVYKGHDNIIATCKVLIALGIKFKWHIIGFSETSTTYRLFYKEHASALHGLIQFHGSHAPSEMIALLLTCNVYVHPSHIENSSNAICEAMALGMPVVALDVGGNTSIIRNNEDGFIVPNHDPYSLAEAIVRISQSDELSTTLGSNAKRHAHLRHNTQTIVSNLRQIYTKVIRPYEY